MFTSNENNSTKIHLAVSLAATVFLAIFGAIYEVFSHGVYSFYMIYAFAIPLIMCVIPYTTLEIRGICPKAVSLRLWNAAAATLATGSLFKGVLDIYGTTNSLIFVYPVAGAILALLGLYSLFLPLPFTTEQQTRQCAKKALPCHSEKGDTEPFSESKT